MKYNAVIEILKSLKIENEKNNENLIENLDYFTKELNFKLGNKYDIKYDCYQKLVNVNKKDVKITLKKASNNEISIKHIEDNSMIEINFNKERAYINNLIIRSIDGIFILDKNKDQINYYDKETISYSINTKNRTNGNFFIDQSQLEEYGIIPDETIELNHISKSHINFFKQFISNTTQDNKLILNKAIKEKKPNNKSLKKRFLINFL